MRRVHRIGTVILLLMMLVSACAPRSEPLIMEGPPLAEATSAPTEPAATEEATEVPTTAPAISEPAAVEPQFPEFDATAFTNSTAIDNQWMPMKPGTKWVYEGSAVDEEGNNVDRRIEFTVTDLTKEIEGVRTVVGWIEDFTDGELTEKEIAFFAQDNSGNVWYFGEHP